MKRHYDWPIRGLGQFLQLGCRDDAVVRSNGLLCDTSTTKERRPHQSRGFHRRTKIRSAFPPANTLSFSFTFGPTGGAAFDMHELRTEPRASKASFLLIYFP